MQRAWMPMLSCAGHYHRDIYPRVVIFVETRKAVHLGNSRGLRLHPLRFVRVRALVELHHILIGGHDALNMLIGELDLPGQWPRRNQTEREADFERATWHRVYVICLARRSVLFSGCADKLEEVVVPRFEIHVQTR
jgi:hypothetical protein